MQDIEIKLVETNVLTHWHCHLVRVVARVPLGLSSPCQIARHKRTELP
jgi:hypothetical protein